MSLTRGTVVTSGGAIDKQNKTFLIMTSNADSRCYMKFDWLAKSVEPIKFRVSFIFPRLTSL